MVLSPRQEKMLAMRDEMAPGAKPSAIVPRNFAEAQQMCGALARSGLVPKAYIERPENMIVTIMSGAEVGLPPMQSLRLYHILDDVPRLGAEGVRAIIMASPSCEYMEFKSSSDTEATWIGKRPGRPEKSVTWTIERAKRAGLANKANWQKSPEDMLNARASMQLGRLIWPEICAGMISKEEAQDGDFIDASYAEQIAKPAFVAPASPPPGVPIAPPGVPIGTTSTGQIVTVAAAAVETPPKRGPGRPPKDKPADPTPAGASKTSPEPSASTSRAATGSNSTAAPVASSPTQDAEKKPAAPTEGSVVLDRWGQPIGRRDPSSAESSPSAESAPTSTSAKLSGAESTPTGDDGFGDDAPDAEPEMSMAGFMAWVAGCKTQSELLAGLPKWRAWSQDRAKAGDASFEKKGKNTEKMQSAYSERKAEVPA